MSETLPSLLLRNARDNPNRTALREKEFGIWRSLSWADYLEKTRNFALGLKRLGIVPGDVIAIIGDNRPEWLIAELATQSIGAMSMGIYQDSVAEEVRYLLDFAEAKVVVAEDQEQVDKLLDLKGHLSGVRHVVYYDPKGMRSYEDEILHPFESIEQRGLDGDFSSNRREFDEAVASIDPCQTAILSTTSGTTGKPKLAMLSHQNLLSMAHHLQATDPMEEEDEFVSFLPLAWIGEQMISASCHQLVGFTVNFPEEPETVQENICEIAPQTMFSPPRIWENMVSDIQVRMEDASPLKRRIFDWATGVGYRVADDRLAGKNQSVYQKLRAKTADLTAHFWLRDKLGLRRIRNAYTGGAALGPDVFRFFHAIGVNLKQIYGQTEVSGLSAIHRGHEIRFHTVGTPLPETEIEIAPNGEILTKGPAVFSGYYKNPEATAESLIDGWLHSGDAGYLDEEGHLVVIDRLKDVMSLPDGSQFSPQFIENRLKFSPYIREAVVFGGEGYEYVTAMLMIDYPNTGKWAEKRQITYTTFTDLSQKEPVYDLVGSTVAKTNAELPASARIRKFVLLHKELDADDEELTRTRKVRRRFVAERYCEIMDGLYSDANEIAIQNEIAYQDGTTATLDTRLRIDNPQRHATD